MQHEANHHEILAWYADAGIDIALQDDPIDRFADTAAQKSALAEKKKAAPKSKAPAKPAAPPAPQQTPAIPDSNAVALAEEAAAKATTLKELQEAVESFQSCNLKFNARTTVFAEGNPKSQFMLIGGTPGREEDTQGTPFVGPSGQLLDRMLSAIGLTRQQVYLGTCAPWRPPGGRIMSPAEIDICRPFVERHIQLADPDILILAGGVATKMLLKSKRDIMSLRGKWVEYSVPDREISTLPTLSPDYLLKNPAHKNLAWQDLLSVKARIKITAE